MLKACSTLVLCTGVCIIAMTSCVDSTESPSDHPAPPRHVPEFRPAGSTLQPVDLVYICGNKFLATNGTLHAVQVSYRVVGTDETGTLTLRPGVDEDPGYSETELATRERGAVELYRNDQLVVRRRNEGRSCGAPAMSAATLSAGAGGGSWSAPFSWPIVALQVTLLPNGKVLSWGHIGDPEVWNPSTGSFTQVPEPIELFCSGHTLLADGRVLVAGGHISNGHGLPNITIFDPVSNSWIRSGMMQLGRWYPNETMLANGAVVIISGEDQTGAIVQVPELWSAGTLRQLTGAKKYLLTYPRAFLAPNGKVFYAGESQTSMYLDPTGTGSWTNVADRLYGVRDYGAAVMYLPGKILYVGGGRTTNTAEIIDLNDPAPAWRWTGSMAFARRHLNATVLPTGDVLVTGGVGGTTFNDLTQSVHAAELWSPATGTWTTLAANQINRGYHATALLLPDGRVLHAGSGDSDNGPPENNAELFSPPYLLQGARPVISSAPNTAAYGGSITLGTPDPAAVAKVSLIHLGSTTHAFDMAQRFEWLSFTRTSGAVTVSIPSNSNVTPPGYYMIFVLDGNNVPSVGRIVQIGAGSAPVSSGTITLKAAARSNSTTQFADLTWSGARTATVDIYRNGNFRKNTPNDGKQTDSRAYTQAATYIYKICQGGTYVCSNTATVKFLGGATTTNKAPIAVFGVSCTELSCGFTDGSVDLDGNLTAWKWSFGDGSTSTLQSPSHAYGSAGTYTVALTVTDNRGARKTASKQVAISGPPVNQPPSANFSSSCDGLDCSFTDGSTDDGQIVEWFWDFGDGASSTEQNPKHSYTADGPYQITLTVTDDGGATASSSQSLSIGSAAGVGAAP